MNLKISWEFFLFRSSQAKHKILRIYSEGFKYFNELPKKNLGKINFKFHYLFFFSYTFTLRSARTYTHYIQHPFICPHEKKRESKYTELDSSRLKKSSSLFCYFHERFLFCFISNLANYYFFFLLSLSLSPLLLLFFIKILSDEAFTSCI